jgi:ankyrin repeat protein
MPVQIRNRKSYKENSSCNNNFFQKDEHNTNLFFEKNSKDSQISYSSESPKSKLKNLLRREKINVLVSLKDSLQHIIFRIHKHQPDVSSETMEEIAISLLAAGINLSQKDECQNSVIHWAVIKGYEKLLSILLECEINVNVTNARGETPLNIAIKLKKINIIKILLNSRKIDLSSYIRGLADSPLLIVTTQKICPLTLELIDCLLIAGANPNDSFKLPNRSPCQEIENFNSVISLHHLPFGTTPLMAIIKNMYSPFMVPSCSLLIDRGANVNAQDEHGNTALMLAVENNLLDVVELLIEQNANIFLNNKHGLTAIDIAKIEELKALNDVEAYSEKFRNMITDISLILRLKAAEQSIIYMIDYC